MVEVNIQLMNISNSNNGARESYIANDKIHKEHKSYMFSKREIPKHMSQADRERIANTIEKLKAVSSVNVDK